MRPTGDKTCPKCGVLYWRKAEWQHKCVNTVVNAEPVVVNKVANVVVNKERSKDRHKSKPERLEYVRRKMREHRLKLKGTKMHPNPNQNYVDPAEVKEPPSTPPAKPDQQKTPPGYYQPEAEKGITPKSVP